MIRRTFSKATEHVIFERFIFACIIATTVLIIIEGPLQDKTTTLYQSIEIINYLITLIFITEMIMKAIVHGFVFNGPGSYLLDGWNILDFAILCSSIITLAIRVVNYDGLSQQSENLLKTARMLRALRLISHSEGLKLSVLSLIYSMPGIINVTVVSMMFILLFGIFFLNLLKGKLYFCSLPSLAEDSLDRQDIVTMIDCINYGGHWVDKSINYDNIVNSIFALFTMCTTEGWTRFMQDSVEAVDIGYQPVMNHHQTY